MERKYDVVIVGAGPAGVFACYELLKKHTGLKIAIVDMGNSFSKRMPSALSTESKLIVKKGLDRS